MVASGGGLRWAATTTCSARAKAASERLVWPSAINLAAVEGGLRHVIIKLKMRRQGRSKLASRVVPRPSRSKLVPASNNRHRRGRQAGDYFMKSLPEYCRTVVSLAIN